MKYESFEERALQDRVSPSANVSGTGKKSGTQLTRGRSRPVLKWLTDEPGKIVLVKSWRPSLGPYGVEWPTMLIDRDGQRRTVTPVWDRNRISELFRRAFRREMT